MKHKKNVLILTINDPTNYGNLLQNYALEQLLGQYADSVSTIKTLLGATSPLKYSISRIRNILAPLKWRIFSFLPGERGLIGKKNVTNRKFLTQHMQNRKYYLSALKGLEGGEGEPNYFVIGSDQVWNYSWLSPDDLYLRLGGLFPEEKTISYAASIGVNTVEGDARKAYSELLPKIRSVSVREDQAKLLVEDLSEQIATVVLDPTLMLNSTSWNAIASDRIPADDRYILTYFLSRPTEKQEAVISRYAKKYHAKIRSFLDARDPETYCAGPKEFLELFSKAQFVFTDSYHACCFSINFNKQFKVFSRSDHDKKSSMNSRMETLGRLFAIENIFGADEDIPEIDYSHVNMLLQQHRQESRDWLEKALSN